MIPEDIEAMVRDAIEQVSEDAPVNKSDDSTSMETALLLGLDGGEGDEAGYTVTFTVGSSDYEGGLNPEYLIISWWIPGEQMLSDDPLSDSALFPLLNDLNQEPGIKCRIDLDENRESANDFIVIEYDLLTRSISRGNIVRVLDRLIDFVTYHAGQMNRYLTAQLEGLA